MKVTILQGINLENPITTIKIECDAEPKKDLLDLVKSFHPVFMENYKFEGKQVSILSKLPHLWKEAAIALNNQATGEWSDKEAKDYLLDTVIKNQVKSMSTVPLIRAAHELGYETVQFFMKEGIKPKPGALYNRYYTVGIGSEQEVMVSISSSKDSYLGVKIQRDKWLTNKLISRLGFPIAKWEIVENKEDLAEIVKDYPKPFIIKPGGLTGGSGVTTNLYTVEDAEKAWDYAKKSINRKNRSLWQQKVMIQQQVNSQAGEDYRLLVISGKLKIATKRIPAFVTGDGTHTVAELIDDKNKDPRRNISDPTHILKPIKIDEAMHNYLEKQGLSIDYVPKKDEKVRIRLPASMSQGGVTEDVTDIVHPQIRSMVESIAASMHAFTIGADVMCLDITKPLTPENGTILEVNTMPEAYLNLFPVYGTQYPEVANFYIKELVKNNVRCFKAVAIGAKNLSVKEISRMVRSEAGLEKDQNVGLYHDRKIYINGLEINSELESWEAIESLKVNAGLHAIVLVYDTVEKIKRQGLGFDKIDLVYVSNSFDGVKDKLIEYKDIGLIDEVKELS
jgi:cyanophycin synthetase